MKSLDKAANIAVILAALLFIFVVVRTEIRKRTYPDPAVAELHRTVADLPGVHFPKQNKSLIIAVSTTCHFCQESLPFYKDVSARSKGRIDVIALLPQPEAEAKTFIQNANISATQIVSAKLSTIGVRGTPTMLLVDERGNVERAWTGELDEKRRQEVLSLVSQ